MIIRGNVGLTVRVYGPHALSLSYVVSCRDARVAGVGNRDQSVETVTRTMVVILQLEVSRAVPEEVLKRAN